MPVIFSFMPLNQEGASYAKVVYWLYSTLWLTVNTSPDSYLRSDKVLCHGFLILCNHRSTNNQFNKKEPSLNLQNMCQEHGQVFLCQQRT